MLQKNQPLRGFIALTSALVISAVMLLIATGGSLAGFYTRVNSLNDEYKERSFALAEACASQRLVVLAVGDPTYLNSKTMNISGGVCSVSKVDTIGTAPNDTYQFRVQGVYGNSYTNIAVVAKVSDLSITSYTEVPMF